MQLKCQTQTMYVISENSSAFPISHASNRPLLLLHIQRAKNETTPFDMAINLFQHYFYMHFFKNRNFNDEIMEFYDA